MAVKIGHSTPNYMSKEKFYFVLFVNKMEGHDLWELIDSVILSKICLPKSLLYVDVY